MKGGTHFDPREEGKLKTSNATLKILNSGTTFLEIQRFSSMVLVSGSGNLKGKALACTEPACVTPPRVTPLWWLQPGKVFWECYHGWHLLPERTLASFSSANKQAGTCAFMAPSPLSSNSEIDPRNKTESLSFDDVRTMTSIMISHW